MILATSNASSKSFLHDVDGRNAGGGGGGGDVATVCKVRRKELSLIC